MTHDAPLYRQLPQMNELLESPAVREWAEREGLGREFVRRVADAWLDVLRAAIGRGEIDAEALAGRLAAAAQEIPALGAELLRPYLRRVVNAAGIIVHTNLGRSPWSRSAADRVAELTAAYTNLEYDLEAGARGGRERPFAAAMEQLLPGAAVTVVNNNAAAVLLMLNTMAQGREVVVSRGQLVEIGGSFRVPEVMEKGFCRLREVGTTNRTRIDDFRAAIGPETGLLLAVHPSNYRMIGFTESVPLEELVQLGRERGVPVAEDLGSGNLIDLSAHGIDEPSVGARLATGVDLVTFSGDKLLGGPQAGFVVGRPEYVARIRANPLYRALRLDKSRLLALEATLLDYVAGRWQRLPALAALTAEPEALQARAAALADRLRPVLGDAGEVQPLATEARAGGGAAPEVALPSWGVVISATMTADELVYRLRRTDPPVIGRIVDDRLVLDVRALLDGDEERIEAALRQALVG